MGDFNTACGISSTTIDAHDKMGYLILVPNTNENQYRNAQYALVHELYYPLGLPIFGNYNGYGNIEEIEEDANTQAYERYFHIKIDKIINIASGYEEVPKEARHKKLLSDIKLMAIRKDVYEDCAKQKGWSYDSIKKELYESGDKYQDTINLEKHLSRAEGKTPKLNARIKNDAAKYAYPSFMSNNFAKASFDIYKESLIVHPNRNIIDRMIDFFNVQLMMLSVNSMYRPSYGGCQYGDINAELHMIKLREQILLDKKHSRE